MEKLTVEDIVGTGEAITHTASFEAKSYLSAQRKARRVVRGFSGLRFRTFVYRQVSEHISPMALSRGESSSAPSGTSSSLMTMAEVLQWTILR